MSGAHLCARQREGAAVRLPQFRARGLTDRSALVRFGTLGEVSAVSRPANSLTPLIYRRLQLMPQGGLALTSASHLGKFRQVFPVD